MNQTNKEWDAGSVAPSPKKYVVDYTHGHKTLNRGDVVVMGETPSMSTNLLIRVSDMTLHNLMGQADQYVHLMEYVERGP